MGEEEKRCHINIFDKNITKITLIKNENKYRGGNNRKQKKKE